jgi:hypothetical protein
VKNIAGVVNDKVVLAVAVELIGFVRMSVMGKDVLKLDDD